MWQRGFGTPAPNANLTDGDADGNTAVDAVDLAVWQSTFGQDTNQNAFSAGAALQVASKTGESGNAAVVSAPTEVEIVLGSDFLGMTFSGINAAAVDSDVFTRSRLAKPSLWGNYQPGQLDFLLDSEVDGVDLLSILTHEIGRPEELGQKETSNDKTYIEDASLSDYDTAFTQVFKDFEEF